MKKLAAACSAFALSACEVPLEPVDAVAFVPTPFEMAEPSDPCNASAWLGLLGQNLNAVILPEGAYTRHVWLDAETGAMTAEEVDFIQTRVSILTDPNDTVIQVFCG